MTKSMTPPLLVYFIFPNPERYQPHGGPHKGGLVCIRDLSLSAQGIAHACTQSYLLEV